MVSFSFEAVSPVANVSAKTKGTRGDNGPASEGFGSLVDSNATDAASTETPASTDRAAPVQRSDETRPASEPGKPREATNRSDKSSAEKPAADRTAGDTSADTGIDASVAIETPIKAAVETGISIATDLLSPDIVIAADATTDADPDAQLPSDQGAVAAGLLTVIAQTGIAPVSVVAPIVPSAETTASTTTTAGVASIAASAIATAAATIEANAAPAPATVTPAATEADGSPDAAPTTQTTLTAELAASIDTPLTSEEQALLSDTAKLAANAKAATGTAATGDATISAETEVSPQIKLEANVSAKTDTAQSEHKPVTESSGADKTVTANADNSAETIAKPEQSEATAAKASEPRAHQTGAQDRTANADIPVQSNTQSPTPAGGPIPAHIATAPAATAAPVLNASVQLASNVAVPLSGLAVNIALNANAGRSSFDIRLDPAELGRIDVRLDVDRHGNVTSHLTVERPSTLDLLRRDAPQLQRALEDAGLKTGDNGLQFSLRDQSQQQQRADDDQSQRNSYRLVVDDVPAIPAEAGRTYARLAAARGGVDIRI